MSILFEMFEVCTVINSLAVKGTYGFLNFHSLWRKESVNKILMLDDLNKIITYIT